MSCPRSIAWRVAAVTAVAAAPLVASPLAAQQARGFFESAAWDAALFDLTERGAFSVRSASEDSSAAVSYMPAAFGGGLVGSVAADGWGGALRSPAQGSGSAAALILGDELGRLTAAAPALTLREAAAAIYASAMERWRAGLLGTPWRSPSGQVAVFARWSGLGSGPAAPLGWSLPPAGASEPGASNDAPASGGAAGAAGGTASGGGAPAADGAAAADVIVTTTPEPSVVALTAVGLVALAGAARRRRARAG